MARKTKTRKKTKAKSVKSNKKQRRISYHKVWLIFSAHPLQFNSILGAYSSEKDACLACIGPKYENARIVCYTMDRTLLPVTYGDKPSKKKLNKTSKITLISPEEAYQSYQSSECLPKTKKPTRKKKPTKRKKKPTRMAISPSGLFTGLAT